LHAVAHGAVCKLPAFAYRHEYRWRGTKHKLAFVTNNASEFWTIARKGTEKAANPRFLTSRSISEFLLTVPPRNNNASSMTLLANGIQGIAISPVDPKNQTQCLIAPRVKRWW
jgi:ribose transport system substrate-binding protein